MNDIDYKNENNYTSPSTTKPQKRSKKNKVAKKLGFVHISYLIKLLKYNMFFMMVNQTKRYWKN